MGVVLSLPKRAVPCFTRALTIDSSTEGEPWAEQVESERVCRKGLLSLEAIKFKVVQAKVEVQISTIMRLGEERRELALQATKIRVHKVGAVASNK